MEFGVYVLLWFTSLAFTVIAYWARNNHAFAVIASVGWIILALNTSTITYVGFGGSGFDWKTVQAGDPSYGGQMLTPLIWYFWLIGIVMCLMTAYWVMMSKKVGED